MNEKHEKKVLFCGMQSGIFCMNFGSQQRVWEVTTIYGIRVKDRPVTLTPLSSRCLTLSEFY